MGLGILHSETRAGGHAMTIKTICHQRQEFYKLHLGGKSYGTIAKMHGLSKECVRYWCRRQRDGGSVKTQWHQPVRGGLSQFEPIVRYVILRLRLQHPRWGPGVILTHLQQRPSLTGKALPSLSSIGRYLHQWPRFRRRRKVRAVHATQHPVPVSRVHQCWQIDFKEDIELHDGSHQTLHTVCDQMSGACVAAVVTPATQSGSRKRRVTVDELQNTLRQAFDRWQTLPEIIQSDNEAVFVGNTRDPFPGRFTLWLTGLGIQHQRIRPGRPTDNAQVERCHQTVCNYAVIGNEKSSPPQLQETLDQAVTTLANRLPSRATQCQARPPVQAYPELLTQPRPWHPTLELAHFDLNRIDALLASSVWQRRVGKTGQICIGGRHRYYSVGRNYAGQDVHVCFDPADRSYVFFQFDDHDPSTVGPEIARRPARYLTFEAIAGLDHPGASIGPQQLKLAFPEPDRGRLLMSK